ncbi:hypothetical protein MYX76_08645 [Desulfobacterota bacterium AH_259_B03_O07]|nr:hypothetical protein [Desulfobacterota bacterium AH_259_B03_O07]
MKILSQLIKFVLSIFGRIVIWAVQLTLGFGIFVGFFIGASFIVGIPFLLSWYLSRYVHFVDNKYYNGGISFLVILVFLFILVVLPPTWHVLRFLEAFGLRIFKATFKTLEDLSHRLAKISAFPEKNDDETNNESS